MTQKAAKDNSEKLWMTKGGEEMTEQKSKVSQNDNAELESSNCESDLAREEREKQYF